MRRAMCNDGVSSHCRCFAGLVAAASPCIGHTVVKHHSLGCLVRTVRGCEAVMFLKLKAAVPAVGAGCAAEQGGGTSAEPKPE